MDDFIAVLSVLPATGRIIRVQAVLAAEISPLNNRLLCLICKVLQIGERIHEAWLRLFDLNVDGLVELLIKAIGVPRRPHLRIDVRIRQHGVTVNRQQKHELLFTLVFVPGDPAAPVALLQLARA